MSKVRILEKYFGEQFTAFVNDWIDGGKAGEKRTQKQIYEGLGVSRAAYQAWKRGETIPDDYNRARLCEFFGFNSDEFEKLFLNMSDFDRYRLDTDFVEELMKRNTLPYCEEIGLKTSFLLSIHQLFGRELGGIFPYWQPIETEPLVLIDSDGVIPPEPYHRAKSDIFTSTAESPELGLLQIEVPDENGSQKVVNLGKGDLLFIRDLQNDVKEYIEFRFMQRKKEMQREVSEANRRAHERKQDGGLPYGFLKACDLNEIDRYKNLMYADEDTDINTEGSHNDNSPHSPLADVACNKKGV